MIIDKNMPQCFIGNMLFLQKIVDRNRAGLGLGTLRNVSLDLRVSVGTLATQNLFGCFWFKTPKSISYLKSPEPAPIPTSDWHTTDFSSHILAFDRIRTRFQTEYKIMCRHFESASGQLIMKRRRNETTATTKGATLPYKMKKCSLPGMKTATATIDA